MLKSYRGYALPSTDLVVYTLEYLCPRCGTENVAIDASEPYPDFCDGSPSTADELTNWVCAGCNYRAEGRKFKARQIDEGGREFEFPQEK